MAGTIERISFRDSEAYDAVQEETVRLHKERYRFAGKFVKRCRVLDIACGVGYGSSMLKDAGAECVIGVDIEPEAIQEAEELQLREGVRFLCADYKEFRVKDSALAALCEKPFDVIVSLETIEHLPDPEDFLKTVLQGLRQGGVFIGSVPVTPSVDANPYHLHDFSAGGFRRMLQNHGLSIRECLRQKQPFHPLSVRREMRENQREGLRKNLLSFYLRHPSKLLLRLASTLRHGFVNIIDVAAAEKVEQDQSE